MKVTLQLTGFPDIGRRVGGDTLALDLRDGATLRDLLVTFDRAHAAPVGTRLFYATGDLDPALQVLRNGHWASPDDLDAPLREGDEVSLLVLVAGG